MDTKDFTTTFLVERTPEEAFAAINDVRGWWSGDVVGGNLRQRILTGEAQPRPW